MAICKDPSVTFLNKFGYNVIKLPRKGIEPMYLVGKDKSTELLGPISKVWKTTNPVPQASEPQPAVDMQGQQSDKLDLSVGLTVLENALKAFGASVPSLNFAYNKARKVQFTFTDVTSTSVEPVEAGNYLASGDLNTANPVISHYFLEDDAEAFLIFDVLKSKSIAVTATDDHGVELKVDVPQIQSVVGANVGVTTSATSQNTVTYSGKEPVSFGFKVFAIHFVNGKWSLAGAEASGALAFSAAAGGTAEPEAADLEPVLLRSGGLIKFKL